MMIFKEVLSYFAQNTPHAGLQWHDTPLGVMVAWVQAGSLVELCFIEEWLPQSALYHDDSSHDNASLRTQRQLADWLRAYFAAQNPDPKALCLAPMGTVFQQRAWQALRAIPYGKTIVYQEQAAMMGQPKACRAVGSANGKNPLSVLVPCHRVLGKHGLGGYSGGLWRKSALLALEQRIKPCDKPLPAPPETLALQSAFCHELHQYSPEHQANLRAWFESQPLWAL